MNLIRVIPCLTISNTELVKTINFKNPNYIGDPINAVRIFNDFKAFLMPFCVLITVNPLDLPPVCIPVYRRYRYKRDDTGATYVHGATGCIHDTQAPRDPYAHRPPAWTPVTPSGRATKTSG